MFMQSVLKDIERIDSTSCEKLTFIEWRWMQKELTGGDTSRTVQSQEAERVEAVKDTKRFQEKHNEAVFMGLVGFHRINMIPLD